MTWEQWKQALAAEARRLWKIHQSWPKGCDVTGLKTVGESIKDWIKRNPAPPNPKKLPKLPGGATARLPQGIRQTGDITEEVRRLQSLEALRRDYGMLRNTRRAGGGVSTLVVLVSLGGGSALALGACIGKMVLEEAAWRAGESIFGWVMEQVDYARLPSTRGQFEAIYRTHVEYELHRIGNVRNNPYAAEPVIRSKERYCWDTYGIHLSVLR